MGDVVWTVVIIGLLSLSAWGFYDRNQKRAAMTPEQRADASLDTRYGQLRRELVCPHCQVVGQVRARQVKRKQGISGAKATGAVLTAGLSTVATGLARKGWVTLMHCGNCKTDWSIAG